MRVVSLKEDHILTICLEGELDHHAAKSALIRIRQMIDAERVSNIVLNFSALTFMDSSGIAVVVQTLRHVNDLDGNISAIEIPPHAFRIFQAAGLTRLIPMSKRTSTSERRAYVK